VHLGEHNARGFHRASRRGCRAPKPASWSDFDVYQDGGGLPGGYCGRAVSERPLGASAPAVRKAMLDLVRAYANRGHQDLQVRPRGRPQSPTRAPARPMFDLGRTQLPVRQGSGFEDSAGARGRGIGATMWRGAFGLICCVAMAFGVRLLLSSPLEGQSTFLFFTLAPCHRRRHSVWRSIARGPHRRVGSGDGHMIPSPRPSVSSRGP
jgi:hypothetical protein